MTDKLTYKENLFAGAEPQKFEFARKLRQELTETEEKLWQQLRGSKINGAKFRRQHPIQFYVLDFYCHEVKLAVELDGRIHELKENKEYDQNRTKALNEIGVTVIRFANEQVEKNMADVIEEINSHLIRLRHLLLKEKDLARKD